MHHKIRLGMIGGGPFAMIGKIHRIAARLDNHYELVGGVFSRDYQKSLQLNEELGLHSERIYSSYHELLAKERLLPKEKRIEVISIVTPNDSHFDIAAAAIEAGFDIIIDKPLTVSYQQAKKLNEIVKRSHHHVCVTYTYTGYPMVKEARELIRSNKLGNVRKVVVTFTQGWLSNCLALNQQSQWRLHPNNRSGTIADIGTHAFHLAEYVSGLKTTQICADINTLVPGHRLDDDAIVILKFDNDARGLLHLSQVSAGDEVNINFQIYAEAGSLHWTHHDPNSLVIKWHQEPTQILRLGSDHSYLSPTSLHHCRITAGHPEGYIEAFANHYRNYALYLKAIKNNSPIKSEWNDYPKIDEGVRGVAFVDSVLALSKNNEKWISFESE